MKIKTGNYTFIVIMADYYIEKGKYVFTEDYLRRRGWCCQNGCCRGSLSETNG